MEITKKLLKTVVEINWNKVPDGTFFTATIHGKKVIGKISKIDGSLYLASNSFGDKGGRNNLNRKGYTHIRHIGDGSNQFITDLGIKDLKLFTTAPKGHKAPIEPIGIAGQEVTFRKGYVSYAGRWIKNEVIIELAKRIAPKK